MVKSNTSLWQSTATNQFVDALVGIDTPSTMKAFLRDVMTEKEIIEMSARLKAAGMLQSGATYQSVCTETKLSSRTVARISQWLKTGNGGYAKAIKITQSLHDDHIPPAHAE